MAGDSAAGAAGMGQYIPVPPPLQLIVRVFVVGNLVSLFLGGIAMAQFFFCFELLLSKKNPEWEQRRTSLKWKLMAGSLSFLFLACVADNVFKTVDLTIFIDHVVTQGLYGVVKMPSTEGVPAAIEAAICWAVQMVYTVRLAAIWPNRGLFVWLYLSLTTICAFAQFGSACWVAYILDTQLLTSWGVVTRKGTIAWWLIASINDILLCGAFVHHLMRMRRQTGFAKTNAVLMKWILLTLETGLLSTIAQVLGLIFLFVWPGDEQPGNFALTLFLAQIYSNSILVLFRTMLKGGLTTDVTNSVPATASNGTRTTSGYSGAIDRWGRPSVGGSVHVTKDVHHSREDGLAHYEMPPYSPTRVPGRLPAHGMGVEVLSQRPSNPDLDSRNASWEKHSYEYDPRM